MPVYASVPLVTNCESSIYVLCPVCKIPHVAVTGVRKFGLQVTQKSRESAPQHEMATSDPEISESGHGELPVVTNCDSMLDLLCPVITKPDISTTVFCRFDLKNRTNRYDAP